jgi:hypothetical protein
VRRLLAALALVALTTTPASAWTAAEGGAAFAQIESRWNTITSNPTRNLRALAELDASASELAERAVDGLRRMRESAAERDTDMAAVIAGSDWRDTEALVAKLRFRIAWIKLERALAGDPKKAELARAAGDGFTVFVDAPDPELAAESRYGRGLARVAEGRRDQGIADLRAAAESRSMHARAELAIAESLADAGRRDEALAMVGAASSGGLPPDLERRRQLLRLRLLLARSGKTAPGHDAADVEITRLASALVKAGGPWRDAAIGLVAGHEDRLGEAPETSALLLRLKADALARSGDAAAALAAYRAVLASPEGRDDVAAEEGLARAALASGEWREAHAAVERLRGQSRGDPRELARIDLRATYGAWHAQADDDRARELGAAIERLRGTTGTSKDDLSEAAFRKAELERAAGRLDDAITELGSVDAEAWLAPAKLALLQCRFMRHEQAPEKEPVAPLLDDLTAYIARPTVTDDARAAAVVLEGTLRSASFADGSSPKSASREHDQANASLVRLRDFAKRYPKATNLVPAALRARARLEARMVDRPDTSLLDALPEPERAALARDIASDLRHDTVVLAAAGAARQAEGRRCLAHAVAFSALAPGGDPRDQTDLAQSALDLGANTIALELFRKQTEKHPDSVTALRGVALAAEASGESEVAHGAWAKIAAMPNLPEVLRSEAASRQ